MSASFWFKKVSDSELRYLESNSKFTEYYFEAEVPNDLEFDPPFVWPKLSIFDVDCCGVEGIEILLALIASTCKVESLKNGGFPGPVMLSTSEGHFSAGIYSVQLEKLGSIIANDDRLCEALNGDVLDYFGNRITEQLWWNFDNPISIETVQEIRHENKVVFELFSRAISDKCGVAWFLF